MKPERILRRCCLLDTEWMADNENFKRETPLFFALNAPHNVNHQESLSAPVINPPLRQSVDQKASTESWTDLNLSSIITQQSYIE
eukprot:snap_masked-scaffold_72-processed-gene-0.41-mRNA-1 protein AED:1.00 eAED:1.00 QI:0/-1/0/0/-1/1/1/0/84